MSLEYQRYGRDKSTLVNSSYINSGEYRNKFDKITDNKAVSRVLYAKAKEMLVHRSGTKVEDMCWIDGRTGEVVASITDETIEQGIRYSPTVEKCIAGRTGLIAMHTHPASLPPSVADFNSAHSHEYEASLVLCHDGKIFQYVSEQRISEKLYNLYIGEYLEKGYSEFDAQMETLHKLKANHKIDFWEVSL